MNNYSNFEKAFDERNIEELKEYFYSEDLECSTLFKVFLKSYSGYIDNKLTKCFFEEVIDFLINNSEHVKEYVLENFKDEGFKADLNKFFVKINVNNF